ncbi:hypothetical protein [Streptomyces kanasensis]|uniref:hypothetical protein n=1 Tax=Streptomyces kanasensis TaxID=936756 RepID=UPI0038239A9C
MHTAITPFTLSPWKAREPGGRRQHGWQGTSPELGGIRVVCPAPPHATGVIVAQVTGGRVPVASFETRGIHTEVVSRPTLNRATCRVGDGLVALERNRWALTHRGRSLRLRYLGDDYRLTAIDKRAYRLTRRPDAEDPGAVLTVRQSGIAGGRKLTVRATGRVLPADVSLAVLFSAVDRSVLTRRGALRAGISRMFGFWAETTY